MHDQDFVKNAPERLVRTFIAVELPSSVRQVLGALEIKFAGHATYLKWTSKDLLHITVRFLGNVPGSRLPHLAQAMTAATCTVRPLTLTTSSLGAFPNERAPRVLWMGLEANDGVHALQRLYTLLEEQLYLLGFAREDRPFSPHVTLGRTRERCTVAERRSLGETLMDVQRRHPIHANFGVDHLTLMRSTLHTTGPIYTPLNIARLDALADSSSG